MLAKGKILVIDDDQSTLEILLLILQNSGFIVEVASNAHHSFKIEGSYPDVILLDNNLGKKNGSEICKELKASEETNHIPVIMISAMEDIKQIAAEACADDFIAKPFGIQLLLEKVNNAILKDNDIS